jgi:hypothetical protein
MSTALSQYQSQTLIGLAGFSEISFNSNPGVVHSGIFRTFMSRKMRYDVYWAHYEGNVYRRLHQFQPDLKAEYDLYSATRTVLSPAYRLGEFWSEHLLGGRLDPDAGDGDTVPSCIPIVSRSPAAAALRAALGQVWRDSNWQVHKDNWTRYGAVLGDVGLMAADDPARQKVFLRVIHPRIVRDVDLDSLGNCKGYIFEEWRPDPRVDPLVEPFFVRYNEIATRVGGRIEYSTYLDDEPWDWRDYPDDGAPRVGPVWTEDYGFVPFVWHQHRDMGLGAGWSELHPSLSKMMELDDLASKIDDQARKMVDSPWFFSGTTAADLRIDYGTGDDDDRDPVRTKIPYFCSGAADAKATPLVAPLNIKAASDHALQILAELERDHIELQADMASASGAASGRALRVARERVEALVAARRAGYDDAQVRAYQMALSIGGMKGYPGFESFDADSFARGDLDISIGDRPVFAVDKMDKIEEVQAQGIAIASLVGAGVPVLCAMEMVGVSPDMIAECKREQDKQQAAAVDLVKARVKAAAAATSLDGMAGVYDTGGAGGKPKVAIPSSGSGGVP